MMRISPASSIRITAGLLLMAGVMLKAQPELPQNENEKEPAPQPVAFSHSLHSRMGIRCRFCHTSARSEARAGLPDSGVCMVCHAKLAAEGPDLGRLLEFHREGREIPWVRYYTLSPDTFFSHRYHLAAGGRCSDCHGEVEKKESLAGQEPLTMAECVGCHLSDGVPTDCGFCHTAALASRPVPPGREP